MQTLTLDEDPQAWIESAAHIAARHPHVTGYEVRFDLKRSRVMSMLDGKLVNAASSTGSGGIGVLVYVGAASAYASCSELSTQKLRELVDRAARLAGANARRSWRPLPANLNAGRKAIIEPRSSDPQDADPADIERLLARATAAARDAQPDARALAAFGSLTRRTWFADSAGSSVVKRSVLSTLRVGATLRGAGRLGEGTVREAGERGIDEYARGDLPERLGADAVARAREALEAVAFPSGRYRVLCDGHLTGMLAHEAVGHLAEFDLVDSGWSALRGRQGEKLAADCVSIRDAPVSPHDASEGVRVPVDDQGVEGRVVTMLDRGVMGEWMHTRETAGLEGVAPTGNGRALDAQFPSIVRMRNTYVEPGDTSLEEALAEMRDGIYLIGARGGAPYSDGSFMFTSDRGFHVRGGEIAEPVRATSIHGNVLDLLKNVRLVTSDFKIHTNFFGGCGKGPQSLLHVGLGGPHVLVEDALVGGHA